MTRNLRLAKDHSILFTEEEMINTTTTLDLGSMRLHNSSQEELRWEKSLKIEHQRIFPDLEIMIIRAKSKKDLHIVCILKETQSIMITLGPVNMRHRISKEKVLRLVKN